MSTTLLCIKLLFLLYVADRWRVTLKGEYPDYINAVFVNVSITASTLHEVSVCKSCSYICLDLCTGLQAAEGFHHSTGSHGVYMQRLLENSP